MKYNKLFVYKLTIFVKIIIDSKFIISCNPKVLVVLNVNKYSKTPRTFWLHDICSYYEQT